MPKQGGQIYDIKFLESEGGRTQKDEEFIAIVRAEAIALFDRSVKYLMPVLNTNNQEYSESPFLNLITISRLLKNPDSATIAPSATQG